MLIEFCFQTQCATTLDVEEQNILLTCIADNRRYFTEEEVDNLEEAESVYFLSNSHASLKHELFRRIKAQIPEFTSESQVFASLPVAEPVYQAESVL